MCVWVYVCGYMCVWVYGGQRRMSDPLELELWAVVSPQRVLETELWSSSTAASLQSCLCSHTRFYFFICE